MSMPAEGLVGARLVRSCSGNSASGAVGTRVNQVIVLERIVARGLLA